jgi:hypothetical protein
MEWICKLVVPQSLAAPRVVTRNAFAQFLRVFGPYNVAIRTVPGPRTPHAPDCSPRSAA